MFLRSFFSARVSVLFCFVTAPGQPGIRLLETTNLVKASGIWGVVLKLQGMPFAGNSGSSHVIIFFQNE